MTDERILKELGHCGLSCGKCLAFSEGDIGRLSQELQQRLGAFGPYAERFATFTPVFGNYPAFEELLEHLAESNCAGCRAGGCRNAGCGVRKCAQEHGIDFCFQCDEFPCDPPGFPPPLKEKWLAIGRRMNDVGAERYYEETRDEPRYG